MSASRRTGVFTRRTLLLGGTTLGGLASYLGLRFLADPAAFAARALRVLPVDEIPPSEPGAALDLLVTGDSGEETSVRAALVAALARWSERIRPDFLVLAGDNVYPHGVASTADPAWKVHFEDVFAGLDVPVYPCLGNHDHEGSVEAQVEYSNLQPLWRFPARWHSFARTLAGDDEVELFVLDTTAMRNGFSFLPSAQVSWLDEALARSSADWKIVVGHHPLYSGGPKGGSKKLRRVLQPIFARHAVDLYLSGHDHDLELLDPRMGWLQLVSGAGSAPDPVAPQKETLFCASGGGFAWVSVRLDALWIQFVSSETGPVASFRVEHEPSA